MIVIVDYGMGNIGSLENIVEKVGGKVSVATKPEQLADASKIILPGVGSFDNGMKKLEDRGFIEPLKKIVLTNKIPLLGICLGMQLLTESSEEGDMKGLGFLKAKTIKFRLEEFPELRIPHMGWNEVQVSKNNPLIERNDENSHFYFVHSYHVVCHNQDDVIATTKYGIDFVSAIQHENIFATQFHPEKSHKFGMKLMKNFVEKV